MENKKKKTSTKKTTKTSSTAKKTTEKKKTTAPKKTTTTKKVKTVKKSETKKPVAKKEDIKKVVAQEEDIKKVVAQEEIKEDLTKEIKKISKEENLEKTYIFNKSEQEDLSEVVEAMKSTKAPSYENIGKLDKDNRKIILTLTIAIVLIVIGCLIYIVVNINRDESLSENNYIDDNTYKNIEYNYDDEEEESSSSKSFKDLDYSNIINTNIDDFEVKVAEGKNMLVIISSDTCYYCVTFEPILNEVLVGEKAKAIRLNITNMTNAETKRLRNYYAFKAAPTLLYIKNGEVVADFEGFMDKDTLTNWYKENVK